MKIKVHTLSKDTEDGTDCEVFATQLELENEMTRIIKASGIDDTSREGWNILNKLEADVTEAFYDWTQSPFIPHLDTYNWDEKEIEIPADVLVEVRGGCVVDHHSNPASIEVHVFDWDSEKDTQTEAEAEAAFADRCKELGI